MMLIYNCHRYACRRITSTSRKRVNSLQVGAVALDTAWLRRRSHGVTRQSVYAPVRLAKPCVDRAITVLTTDASAAAPDFNDFALQCVARCDELHCSYPIRTCMAAHALCARAGTCRLPQGKSKLTRLWAAQKRTSRLRPHCSFTKQDGQADIDHLTGEFRRAQTRYRQTAGRCLQGACFADARGSRSVSTYPDAVLRCSSIFCMSRLRNLIVQDTGFFLVSDHGIEQGLIDEAFEKAKSALDLPDEVKKSYPFSLDRYVGWRGLDELQSVTGELSIRSNFVWSKCPRVV